MKQSWMANHNTLCTIEFGSIVLTNQPFLCSSNALQAFQDFGSPDDADPWPRPLVPAKTVPLHFFLFIVLFPAISVLMGLISSSPPKADAHDAYHVLTHSHQWNITVRTHLNCNDYFAYLFLGTRTSCTSLTCLLRPART